MTTGKDFYDFSLKLGGFIAPSYNIHVLVVSTILGGLSTAYVNNAPVEVPIKIVLALIYLTVGVSTLIVLSDVYTRLNSSNAIARRLFEAEMKTALPDIPIDDLNAMTRPVKGLFYKRIFPFAVVVFTLLIVFFPSA